MLVSRKPQRFDVPAASRSKSGAWRDPRLWVGVALVAGSVVAGSVVVSAADDSTAVWAATRDLAVGEVVSAEDLALTKVAFERGETGGHYLSVSETLPADLTVVHAVDAGELVPSSALGTAETQDVVAVSVAVGPEHLPVGVEVGSRVDFWVAGANRAQVGRAKPVLLDVAVLAVPTAEDSFAGTATRQLVVAVPKSEQNALAELLAASGEGLVRVVGRL